VSRSSPLIPITAFIGVRISWLIAARNALFAWFAESASTLASSSSAVRSATRRSSVSTSSRSWAVMSSNATASVPTSSSERTPEVACRSPAWTRLAVAARARMGRVTRRATSAIAIASSNAETRPTSPIVSASWRADPNASSWVISATSPAAWSGSHE
jgi:hypothetical protein